MIKANQKDNHNCEGFRSYQQSHGNMATDMMLRRGVFACQNRPAREGKCFASQHSHHVSFSILKAPCSLSCFWVDNASQICLLMNRIIKQATSPEVVAMCQIRACPTRITYSSLDSPSTAASLAHQLGARKLQTFCPGSFTYIGLGSQSMPNV